MGWDVTNVGSNITTKKFVEWEYKNLPAYELLAIGQGKRIHGEVPFYLALKNRESGEVSALVVLSKRRNGQVALKAIDETSGPFAYDCPKSVFKLLTPTDSKFANEWRSIVAKSYDAPKLENGDKIIFDQEISFVNGWSGHVFIWLGGSKFLASNGSKVLISNWRSYKHEVFKQEREVA
jgi:hypothetical protein